MLFNSYLFLFIFLPVTLIGWWLLRGSMWRLTFLTIASYVFYATWNWRFVPLMLASTTADYVAGARIAATDDERVRKWWLIGSLTFNLSILGFFKYFDFFARSVDDTARHLGAGALIPILHIALPVGISFYTFNSMSYTIDIWRGVVRPARSLLHFSAFVSLFPHLVAGPIVRFSDIEEQFAALKRRLSWSEAGEGIYFFVAGLAKKILLADTLADLVVNPYFHHPQGQPLLAAWAAILGYTFQLYFDFSGYSDMAVGLAHLLGIQFPQNFNSPYRAVNISDFWTRWHMSLSTWLRDYLFLPIARSRMGRLRVRLVLALFITMFLGGLWHGANWTFVLWGLYQFAMLALYQVFKAKGWVPRSEWVARGITFFFIVLDRVLFRSDSVRSALTVYASMSGAHGLGHLPGLTAIFWLLLAAALAFWGPNTWEIRMKPTLPYACGLALILTVAVLSLEKESPFLYFQF